jgi:hypothetical protein
MEGAMEGMRIGVGLRGSLGVHAGFRGCFDWALKRPL